MRFLFWLTFPLLSSASLHADTREVFDFNFDGHPDYRVMTHENGKADLFDVFIFDPQSKTHHKDATLSGTIYPTPDAKHKEVRCIWSGGHSGAIYTGTIFTWINGQATFSYTVKQTSISVDGNIIYVRAKARVIDGVSQIFELKQVKPHWEE